MKCCPVCIADLHEPRIIERKNGYTLVHCTKCDVVFSDPIKPADGKWYQDQVMYVVRDHFQPGRLQWNHKQFLKYCPARGQTLLDVGCGTGEFMVAARNCGYQVTGIDFDPSAVKLARERNELECVYTTDLDDLGGTHGDLTFDVITAFEVLEHIATPRAFLSNLKKLLSPQGYLVISVPFRDRWPAFRYDWDFPPHHFTRWSKKAIETFLSSNGFRVLKIQIGWAQAESLLHQYLQFGIASRLIIKARDRKVNNNDLGVVAQLQLARKLFLLKYFFIKVLSLPVNVVLALLGATGLDMYVLAQKS